MSKPACAQITISAQFLFFFLGFSDRHYFNVISLFYLMSIDFQYSVSKLLANTLLDMTGSNFHHPKTVVWPALTWPALTCFDSSYNCSYSYSWKHRNVYFPVQCRKKVITINSDVQGKQHLKSEEHLTTENILIQTFLSLCHHLHMTDDVSSGKPHFYGSVT